SECRGDAPDDVGCQKLHYERDKVGGHGTLHTESPQPQSRYTPKASSKLDPNQKGLGVSKVCFAQPSYPVFGSRRADHSTRHHETDSTERLTTTHNVRGFIADYRVLGGILRRSLKPSRNRIRHSCSGADPRGSWVGENAQAFRV